MGRLPRRQKTLAVNIPYRGSKGPLDLLVDSTGIKVEGEGEWHARKHGGSKRRVWRKIHLGIDEQTLEARAVEVTGSHIGDPPMLPELLDQIPADQEVGSVTADGAYDTRRCHRRLRGACRRSTARERQTLEDQHQGCRGAQRGPAGLEIPRSCDLATMERIPPPEPRRDQDALYKPKVREAKLLGQRLMARDFDRQVAEIHVRIAVLNGYTALGTPFTEPVG